MEVILVIKIILGILFIIGILVLCVWLRLKSRLKSGYITLLNQLWNPEKHPPNNKKMLDGIAKRYEKDQKRK